MILDREIPATLESMRLLTFMLGPSLVRFDNDTAVMLLRVFRETLMF